MAILVLNSGSSSLKFGLFDLEADPVEALISGSVDWHGRHDPAELTVRPKGGPEKRSPCQAEDSATAATLAIRSVAEVAGGIEAIKAVGHRVVHGGTRFLESVRIDGALESELKHLSDLAPLHNPPALRAIDAAIEACPGVPQVAAFDTSFFAHLPRSAATYAVPWEWSESWGVRKFGFHGISHSYCAGRAAEVLGRDPKSLRLVVCHLGNGCSAAAIRGGSAVDTTMGFTPLDGLMMGTRSGSVDPGVLTYVIDEKGLTAHQVDDALNHASGLLGVSGVSADYRQVEASAKAGNDRARLALEIYSARIKASIGSLAATLGGLDALVFAAGVGENSASLRASACEGLEFLGVRLDPGKNDGHPVDADIAADGSAAKVLVIHTREELMIAREVRRVLG